MNTLETLVAAVLTAGLLSGWPAATPCTASAGTSSRVARPSRRRRRNDPFHRVGRRGLPLDRANVDTDAIIPKQFLKSIKRAGFGPNLFDEWRYLDHGEPGMDCAGGR